MRKQFNDREKSFEAKFKMDQVNTFKVEARGIDYLGHGSQKSSDCQQPSMKYVPKILLWLIARTGG